MDNSSNPSNSTNKRYLYDFKLNIVVTSEDVPLLDDYSDDVIECYDYDSVNVDDHIKSLTDGLINKTKRIKLLNREIDILNNRVKIISMMFIVS